MRNDIDVPTGNPALLNPMKMGIDEQLQNGVTVPRRAPATLPFIPLNLPIISLDLSGGK